MDSKGKDKEKGQRKNTYRQRRKKGDAGAEGMPNTKPK